jgi:hypothetical protein
MGQTYASRRSESFRPSFEDLSTQHLKIQDYLSQAVEEIEKRLKGRVQVPSNVNLVATISFGRTNKIYLRHPQTGEVVAKDITRDFPHVNNDKELQMLREVIFANPGYVARLDTAPSITALYAWSSQPNT